MHEVMITKDDCRNTYEYDKHYIIYPDFDWWDQSNSFKDRGIPVNHGFEYSSETNIECLGVKELYTKLKKL
ncbi:MAG: hypothetical protein JJE17_08730 [Peptostreptococcaceae bacterium]|nr:hypothetical protein [Peptostreptococcaceae bacterium]